MPAGIQLTLQLHGAAQRSCAEQDKRLINLLFGPKAKSTVGVQTERHMPAGIQFALQLHCAAQRSCAKHENK
jgi:hypothetical protein